MAFGDEGAANHTRLCADYGAPGVQLFVYGQRAFDASANGPRRYPARQTLEASQAVARQHGLNPVRLVFAQQAPAAIDAGVFHNDVIAVGNRDVLFYHQHAFADADATLAALADAMHGVGASLRPLQVPAAAVSIEDAVRSYLFNSQLLSRADGRMLLVVPEECRHVEPHLPELRQPVQRIALPSTSPAHAAMGLEALREAWSVLAPWREGSAHGGTGLRAQA